MVYLLFDGVFLHLGLAYMVSELAYLCDGVFGKVYLKQEVGSKDPI